MRDNLRKETEASLNLNWIVIASLAWKGYQNMGRGYLLIDELPPVRMRYLSIKENAPDMSDASQVLQDWGKSSKGFTIYGSKRVTELNCSKMLALVRIPMRLEDANDCMRSGTHS